MACAISFSKYGTDRAINTATHSPENAKAVPIHCLTFGSKVLPTRGEDGSLLWI